MTIARWLEDQGAHRDVVEWAEPFADDLDRLWESCPRGDWLLGIAARAGAPRREVVQAARACAELALDQVPDREARVAEALAATDRWLDGEDAPEARARAAEAAEAAADGAPDPAAQAAAMAARATVGAIDAPDEAAAAVAMVVQAAMLDVGECAVMSAVRYAQATCADRVREHVSLDGVRDAITRAR